MTTKKRKSAYSLALEQVQGKEQPQENGNAVKDNEIPQSRNDVTNGEVPQNSNAVENRNAAKDSEAPQSNNVVGNRNTAKNSEIPQNSEAAVNRNTAKDSEIPQNSNAVENRNTAKSGKTAKITIYPTQEQVNKLYDLMEAYRRKTGFKINQQDMIRRLIDLANENTVLP